jgi:hypothetical protein
MLEALFSRECRDAGPVPLALWGERGGILALDSYYPTTYLPLIVRHDEYWQVPAYRSWPCVVVANPDDAATKRVLADAQARDPNVRLVSFTDGPLTRRVVAIVRAPSGAAPPPAPSAPPLLYAVHRSSPLRGSALGAFRDPADLALAPDGRRFALDAVDRVVTEFRPDGRPVRRFGGPDRLVAPTRLAADERGVLVLDEGGQRLVRFDPDGRFRSEHDFRALGLKLPRGLAFDGAGRLLVADEAQASLFAFGPDMAPLGRPLEPAGGPAGRPFRPSDVEVGSDGRVYVYDATAGLARRLDRDGRTSGSWEVGLRNGRLGVAPDGSFWVGGPGRPVVRRFDGNGAGPVELGPGTFLGDAGEDVRAIVVDRDGRIDLLWRSGRLVSYRLQA